MKRIVALGLIFLFCVFGGGAHAGPKLWEVTDFSAGGLFFEEANCNVASSSSCPPEMGWEGHTVYYIFDLPSDQLLTPSLELEFNVIFGNYGGVENVLLEVSAGKSINDLTLIEPSIEIDGLRTFSILIDSSVFQKGSTNYIKLYGTNISPVGYGQNPPNFKIDYISLSLYGDTITAPAISDEALWDQTQATAAKYFFEQGLSNGLVKDANSTSYSSIAATGFGLTALAVMANRYGSTSNWTYTPAQLRARTNQILDTLAQIQNQQAVNENLYGKEGLFFHFINSNGTALTGSEVSTIDTAILFAGIIAAGEYFGAEVKQKAESIIGKANWAYFLRTSSNDFPICGDCSDYQFAHGWKPSGGIMLQTWNRPTDEAILISVIASASDLKNRDFQKSLFSWPRVKRSYAGYELVNSYFGSLFTYEFGHAWIDFQKLGGDKASQTGVESVNWWTNSVMAAKAARQFAIDNATSFSSYGPDSWGFSAVQKPNGEYNGYYGSLPTDSGTAMHDGTLAPYSSIGTMPFFKSEDNGVLLNNKGFRALRHFYDSYYYDLWGTYGPKDSFNHLGEFNAGYLGIDQGLIVLMLENYRSGFVWEQFMKNRQINGALRALFVYPTIAPMLPALLLDD